MLAFVVSIFLFAALTLYIATGGADFGGGVWDLFATGPRASKQRDAITKAISPIWEADHVWLILAVVLLFTAFPMAFGAMMTALHIPITLMLIGIILRGAGFIFRKYDSKAGTPLITFIYDGTHKYPAEAPALIVKFFKEQAKPEIMPATK